MMSTRKRKMMISKLNKFFEMQGKIPTEAEYMAMGSVPYRIGTVKKYLRNWPGMVAYLKAYYPRWKEVKPAVVKEEKVEEKAPLKAFYSEKKDEDE